MLCKFQCLFHRATNGTNIACMVWSPSTEITLPIIAAVWQFTAVNTESVMVLATSEDISG